MAGRLFGRCFDTALILEGRADNMFADDGPSFVSIATNLGLNLWPQNHDHPGLAESPPSIVTTTPVV